jgi:alkaline phosphatase D
MSRRTFLALSASVVAGACTSSDDGTASPNRPSPSSGATVAPPDTRPLPAATVAPGSTTSPSVTTGPSLPADPFRLGVSAGDPDETGAVLWTRLVGDDLPDELEVTWEVAADESFDRIIASGVAPSTVDQGHSVHATADLEGPSWYRFRIGGHTSPVGRAAPTAGASDDPLRIATASCQHFETGFYAAHRDIAEWQPDLVVFLGDFIYEYGAAALGGEIVRVHDGPEVSDIASYRDRYALYLSDPDLQASRRACPWVSVWDDHEVENNYAGSVPENPADRAAFAARRAAAYRAWWEHMPVRMAEPVEGTDFPIHRTVRWGELVDLIMLDGRQYRSDQACGDAVLSTEPPCPAAALPERTMLGAEQERWLVEQFEASTARWPVLGQQTVLSDVRLNGAILNYDQWDGYDPARQRLLARAADLERLIVLTGDIHLAGVGVLPGVGVEFVATSISSTGLVELGLEDVVISFDDIVDAELAHRGYTRHTVTNDAWTADYRIVGNVHRRQSPVTTWKSFRVDADRRDVVNAI